MRDGDSLNISIELDKDFKAIAKDIDRLLTQWTARSAHDRQAKVRAGLWLQRLRAFQCGRQAALQRTRNDYALLLKQACVTGRFLSPIDKAPAKEDLHPLQRNVVWSLRRWEKVEALLDPDGRTRKIFNILARDDVISCDTTSVIDRFLDRVNRKSPVEGCSKHALKQGHVYVDRGAL
ncbi:hypothetical protein FOL47_004205 [Perkinsus chesapeaki]|uniref:DUF4485 domain-containing protein n=1 Tax=Perkinsus chesapeaki TaxID=330153 RepID=A0A7J6M500_PERCH|nr:hypothetical protein FOL47_004205 [Perkinsus chesapeaki]